MLKSLRKTIATLGASLLLAIVPSLGLSAAIAYAEPAPVNINDCLAQGSGLDPGTGDTCNNAGTSQGAEQIQHIVTVIVNIFSVVVGIVAVIMIIVGGFKYITSGGDSGNIASAKNTIIYAIIGLVVVALSQFIVQFVLEKITPTGS